MRKDRVYKVTICLSFDSFDITGAECGCPAGKGPNPTGKHICGLCYALEEFSRIKKNPEYRTYTDKLQQWNKPRPRKLPGLPVAQLTSRREEDPTLKIFDPQPLYQRHLHERAIETLCCDFLSLNKPTAFLDILVPSLDNIRHDHSYTQSSRDQVYMSNTAEDEESTTEESEMIFTFDFLSVARCAIIERSFDISAQENRELRY